jgi:predicted nucleotidyltransferase
VKQPEGLSSSVRVRFLDVSRILERLKSISRDVLRRNSNVLGIYLFGSLVKGTYVPGSDADILIVLNEDNRRFIDRMPEFLRFFLNVPIAIDVFPYTSKEIEGMIADQNPFITTLWKEKTVLAERVQ